MPRKLLLKDSTYPYHVVNRSNDREAFPVSMPVAWGIFRKILIEEAAKRSVLLHAFVLMPNHFHLLLSTPNENIDDFMRDFQTKTSKALSYYSERGGHRFQSRYKWSLIRDEAYYRNCIRYVYQNPMRGKMVRNIGDYPFSTYREMIQPNVGHPPGGHPNVGHFQKSIFNFDMPSSDRDWERFITEPLEIEGSSVIKKALKKRICNFSFESFTSRNKLEAVKSNLGMTQALGQRS